MRIILLVIFITSLTLSFGQSKKNSYRQALEMYQNKEWVSAAKKLEQCLKIFKRKNKESAHIHHAMGLCYINLKQYKKATFHLEKSFLKKEKLYPHMISYKSFRKTYLRLCTVLKKQKKAVQKYKNAFDKAIVQNVFDLVLIRNNEKYNAQTQDIAIHVKDTLELSLKKPGNYYCYQVQPQITYLPQFSRKINFVNERAYIQLSFSRTNENALIWLHSDIPLTRDKQREKIHSLYKKRLQKFKKKGVLKQNKIEHFSNNFNFRLFFAHYPHKNLNLVANIRVSRQPIKVELVLNNGIPIEPNKKIKNGNLFSSMVTNISPETLNVYGFHFDKNSGTIFPLENGALLQPDRVVSLPKPGEGLYQLHGPQGWECQIFFYSKSVLSVDEMKQTIKYLKNKWSGNRKGINGPVPKLVDSCSWVKFNKVN